MSNQFDIVITCMGRLEHLKQSLPLAIQQYSAQCYLVDYSCPEFCGDWVEQQNLPVKVIRVQQQTHFHTARAKNTGAYAGQAPWILFLDADILLADNFTEQLSTALQEGFSYHADPIAKGVMGSFLCQRAVFQRIGGFDEVLHGWGCEDGDLYGRLRMAGIKKATFPDTLLRCIDHSDHMRAENFADKDMASSLLYNRLYLLASHDLTRISGSWPQKKTRQHIYQLCKTAASQVLSNKTSSDVYITLGKEIVRDTELSRVLHYHLDASSGIWTAGQASQPAPASTDFNNTRLLLQQRWPDLKSHSSEAPVFILAAGFRSGSTLLQRMLLKQCWIWGEPYGHASLIEHLMTPFLQLNAHWPADDFIETHERFSAELEQRWVANLYPAPQHLLSAAQQYLQSLLKNPALQKGYQRWGLKEVRLTADHGHFLRYLYPEARFLLLYRNPYKAYRSYRKYQTIWYLRSPDQPVDSPEKFARHWLATTQSYLQQLKSLHAYLLSYEDLIRPDFDFSGLEQYLGFSVDKSALQYTIPGTPATGFKQEPDISKELQRLAKIVGPLASQLGYTYP